MRVLHEGQWANPSRARLADWDEAARDFQAVKASRPVRSVPKARQSNASLGALLASVVLFGAASAASFYTAISLWNVASPLFFLMAVGFGAGAVAPLLEAGKVK